MIVKNLFLVLCICVSVLFSHAQDAKESLPPYKKTLTIPNFTVFKLPDSTKFTNLDFEKGKKTIIVFFGPECGHCSVFAKKMMDSIDLFKHTQIMMVSSFDYGKIRKFSDEHKLLDCPFMTVGNDKDYFFISHYGIRAFPSAYVYNTKGKFVKSFESEICIKELAETK
jgi:thioredoxin-related protein